MFKCKDDYKISRYVDMEYMKDGWVPACILCYQNLYLKPLIKNVTGLNLTQENEQVTISWNASSQYYTEIQIKMNDGNWQTLSLIEPGIGVV